MEISRSQLASNLFTTFGLPHFTSILGASLLHVPPPSGTGQCTDANGVSVWRLPTLWVSRFVRPFTRYARYDLLGCFVHEYWSGQFPWIRNAWGNPSVSALCPISLCRLPFLVKRIFICIYLELLCGESVNLFGVQIHFGRSVLLKSIYEYRMF